jgi:site-specific recombinase XerD
MKELSAMVISDQNRRPLGLFVDQATPLLYTSLIETFRVRHYSPRTQEAYVHWIRRYLLYHQFKHPRLLKESDVNHFLTYLAVKETVSASTQNQALSAILFLYEHVLKQPLDRIDGVVRARRSKRLPVVLTVDEVARIMAHLKGDNPRTNEQGRHHMDESLVQRAVALAARETGLTKRVTC